MKKTLQAGMALFTLALLGACSGDDNSAVIDNAALAKPEPEKPPFYLAGKTYVYDDPSLDTTPNHTNPKVWQNGIVEHNNANLLPLQRVAMEKNPIYDLNSVSFYNAAGQHVVIPLPKDGATVTNRNINGQSYTYFFANNTNERPNSRYGFFEFYDPSREAIFNYQGQHTQDMPTEGEAHYEGEAYHTFFAHDPSISPDHNLNVHRIVSKAVARADVNFGAKDKIINFEIRPYKDQYYSRPDLQSFEPFKFAARIQDHRFNGENVNGSLSSSYTYNQDFEQVQGTTVHTDGQFNGKNAKEIVGHYVIQSDEYKEKANRTGKTGGYAEGVFGLSRQ